MCDSLFYKLVQSPMCDWIVERVPFWVAPNLITGLGFLLNVLTFVLMFALYGNSVEGPVDSWFCLFMCTTFFIYNTLDNCDGKQARRTGSGSPMGMLFDHGCDATTAVINNILFQRMMLIGGGWRSMLSMMVSTIPAYYLILEEYYLGTLLLPMFSGPDDISIAYYFICCYTAYYGSDIWEGQFNFLGFGEMKFVHVLLYAIAVIEFATVFSGVLSNLWHGRNTPHFKHRFTPASFARQFGYMLVLVAIYGAYEFCPGTQASELYPRLTMLAYGGQFLQAHLRMLLAGVQNEIFNPFRRTSYLVWALLAINVVSCLTKGFPVMDEYWLFVSVNVIAWSANVHFVYFSLHELMKVLNINMFTMTTRQLEVAKQKTSAKKDN